jgi:hypothetical protein
LIATVIATVRCRARPELRVVTGVPESCPSCERSDWPEPRRCRPLQLHCHASDSAMRMRLLRVVLSAPLECTLHCVHTCARVHLYQRAVRVECPVCRVKQCLYLDDVLTPAPSYWSIAQQWAQQRIGVSYRYRGREGHRSGTELDAQAPHRPLQSRSS